LRKRAALQAGGGYTADAARAISWKKIGDTVARLGKLFVALRALSLHHDEEPPRRG